VYVGVAKLSLVLGDSHSLKDKRMVLRRIKDRVRERLGVTLNEVGAQDIWQRSELGCAVVSAERAKALEVIDDVVRIAIGAGGADVVAIAREVSTFDAEFEPYVAVDERTGAGDKAQGADADWVPDEWRDEAQK
jgi:uncharacterized protein YlxP (DUF503 family)